MGLIRKQTGSLTADCICPLNVETDRAPDGELVVDGEVLAGEVADDAVLVETLVGPRLREEGMIIRLLQGYVHSINRLYSRLFNISADPYLRVVPKEEVRGEPHELNRHVLQW